ncbi:MAG: 3-deoxy-D-manno-octulosonic acid transferase [Candidatus Cloacimonetes bacterium]|nr:3-deoxy-D-manno-octulosonic acid transferase [Candidatus Cloacimonadota bacterium]
MDLIYKSVFQIANLMIEGLWLLLYPFIYMILRLKGYEQSLALDFPDTAGGFVIHAASVGEVNAVKPLIKSLLKQYPASRILLTTNTRNGLKTARGIHPDLVARIAPLDLRILRWVQLKRSKPALIIIMETELWLNLLWAARLRQIPVLWVNARMSERSLKRYLKIKPLLRSFEPVIKCICAQSDADAVRFRTLFDTRVVDCGNLKFALDLPEYDKDELRRQWQYETDNFIITCGSTRPGEEKLFLDVFRQLIDTIPQARIILAIRHPERLSEVINILNEEPYSLHSQGGKPHNIHIIDTIGHLNEAYAISDVAIVGGSFFDFGGHNPLEPAYYQKPILMGKYHGSCVDSVRKLLDNNAIIITEPEHLFAEILNLYKDKNLGREMGERAKRVLTQYQHSLNVHLNEIMRVIEHK